MKTLQEEFKNPGNMYRPIPFWSWNDDLDVEELRNQIRELKKSGVGGYFMHARSGLKTEYLSEDWFSCIEAGIREGEQQGLDAWIYDEEGWPSGFAGGLVPALSEAFHAKYITCCKDVADESDRVSVLGEFHIGGETWLVKKHRNPFYIDTMNRQAVEAFLASTHEEYYKRFGQDFGSHMKGFFTDEPRLTCDREGELAWSDELPGEFEKSFGYSILDHLPSLFYPVGEYEKVRYDFWCTVNRMFTENYMKTIYDWCEAHNCKVTGHIMMEESIFSQITSTGGVMPFYEYMHVPGIDWLRRRIDTPLIGKQVGSVACQLGKGQVLTESFALCGWGVSLEELKWIAEWQFANGVNQICQHLAGYSLKGARKRDYPPSLFTQQTWWEDGSAFHDYLGRQCAALSMGDQVADVLVLHPMRSAYLVYDGSRTEEIRKLDDHFAALSCALSGQQIGYHYGDETILARYGRVEGGKLIVGRIGYKALILPHMHSIDQASLELLLGFAREGGKIFHTGRLPSFTNGSREKLDELCSRVIFSEMKELREKLEKVVTLGIRVSSDTGDVECISYLERQGEGEHVYFLVNHSQEGCLDTCVRLPGHPKAIYEMEEETGEYRELEVRREEGASLIDLTFAPMESHMLCTISEIGQDKAEIGLDKAETRQDKEEGDRESEGKKLPDQMIGLGKNWTLSEPFLNAMTLDLCDYRIEGEDWVRQVPVIRVQDILLNRQKACRVDLRFFFEMDMAHGIDRGIQLVVEEAGRMEIHVNGVAVSSQSEGWWKDKSFDRITIGEHLRAGRNEISLSLLFSQPDKVYEVLFGKDVYETEKNKLTYDVELENIYLYGQFGVYSKGDWVERERKGLTTPGPFVIRDMPESFDTLDLTRQGCLFTAESVKVTQILSGTKEADKRQMLCLEGQEAPLIKVYVNGKLVKHSLWAPYEADVSGFWQEGDNEVTLEIFFSNRNLFGPHHHIDGECYNVGPESFTGKWSWVERKSEADATDILDRNKNYWTDTYTFIRQGIDLEQNSRIKRHIRLKEVEEAYKKLERGKPEEIEERLREVRDRSNVKIIVLDDDPTGTQTLHDVYVYTDWSEESLRRGFQNPEKVFFVLTNSRALTEEQTQALHGDLAQKIAKIGRELGIPYMIVSRSDSTLRGHFPLETQVIKETLEEVGGCVPDGEILVPCFFAGGRFTLNNTHYVKKGQWLIPAGETEFARDKTFGYRHSDLPGYVEEKTGGSYRAEDVICISLEDLRANRLEKIVDQLLGIRDFKKCIVNALAPGDLKVFVTALFLAMEGGKHFLLRSAAQIIGELGGIRDIPLLQGHEMVSGQGRGRGGVVIVGSHTEKTTSQLEALRGLEDLVFIEFQSDRVLEEGGLEAEVKQTIGRMESCIREGRHVVVYTNRRLLTLEGDSRKEALIRSVKISEAVSRLVGDLGVEPAFVVAKGGITSSDIGVKALRIRKALVCGQIQPGVTVWKGDEGSKFPGVPYVIFPGNVGDEETLRHVVEELIACGGKNE